MLDLFGISVLAGLGEEMLFRGLIQDVFSSSLPLWMAVALASLLFGMMHAVTPTYAVLAGLMGAYLGWLYLATGNLLGPIVAHAVYDFVALVYLMYGPGSGEIAEQKEAEPATHKELQGETKDP